MAVSKLWMPQKYEIPWASIYYSRSISPISISHNKFIICDELIGLWNDYVGKFSFGEFTEETNAWKIKTLKVLVKKNNAFKCENQKGIPMIRFIRNVIAYDSKSQILYLLDKLGNLWWFDLINHAVNCSALMKFPGYQKFNVHIELVNGKIVFIPRRKECKHGACIIDFANSQMFVHEKFILQDSWADKFDIIRLNYFKGLIC